MGEAKKTKITINKMKNLSMDWVNGGEIGRFFLASFAHSFANLAVKKREFNRKVHKVPAKDPKYREPLKIDSLRPLHNLCAPCG